jgi:hypothetical protein
MSLPELTNVSPSTSKGLSELPELVIYRMSTSDRPNRQWQLSQRDIPVEQLNFPALV